MTALNEVRKYLSEIFDEANKSSDPVSVLKTYLNKEVRLLAILGYAINPRFRIGDQIPDGVPPFKESDLPLGKAELTVLDLHKQFYIMFNPNLKKYKKEEFFIRWLESMHPTDAKILVAIKDQKLSSVYPKLTNDVIRQALGWSETDYKNLFNKQ